MRAEKARTTRHQDSPSKVRFHTFYISEQVVSTSQVELRCGVVVVSKFNPVRHQNDTARLGSLTPSHRRSILCRKPNPLGSVQIWGRHRARAQCEDDVHCVVRSDWITHRLRNGPECDAATQYPIFIYDCCRGDDASKRLFKRESISVIVMDTLSPTKGRDGEIG